MLIYLAYKLIDNPKAIFKLSAGPSIEYITGGKDCSNDNDCGHIMTGSLLGGEFLWKLNKQITVSLANDLSSTFASKLTTSNNFNSNIKYANIKVVIV